VLPAIDSLRCFVEAARFLNFRAAARAVALTPAALGQRIKQLEDLTGQRLFARTTRKVTLTAAGLSLLPHAREVLAAAERAVQATRGQIGPAPMDLVVGTRHELGMSWVVPGLPALRKTHPQVTFHLYFGSGPDLHTRVRSGDVHCAIGSMRIRDPQVGTLPLHPERYALVASPKLLKAQPLKTPADCRQHTLLDIDLTLPLFGYLRDAEGGDEVVFGRAIALGAGASVRALVLAGEGVAVLPEYMVQKDLAARRLVRLLPRQPIQQDWFRLYFRDDDPRRPLFESIAGVLRERPLE
jgi:LysR family transcriptional regulator, glycine cleavage system transcriptional activator